MPILHAIVLGVVQGLSEFLPISSSGHLAIVPWLFGWDDFGDNDSLAKAFDVALHIGTLAGAIAYFRRDLVTMAVDGLKMVVPRNRIGASPEGRMAWLLVVSAVPAAITGAALDSTIEELDAFMQEHPEIELYDGQDQDSAEACSSCATPPAGSDASTHSEEEVTDADLSALEPCLTRITVKICYGDEELLLTTNTMCFPLLR